jgi:protein-tyrosine phosphatase
MAEVLLARAAAARPEPSGGPVGVGSAGVWAEPGLPASDGSVAAMARMGLDLSAHRSRRVSAQLLDDSDLVVTMESRHVVELVSQHPDAVGRVFALRELVELVEGTPPAPGDDLAARLAVFGEQRSVRDHLGRSDQDVVDPIGGSRAQYRRCAKELDQLCDALATWLWGPLS